MHNKLKTHYYFKNIQPFLSFLLPFIQTFRENLNNEINIKKMKILKEKEYYEFITNDNKFYDIDELLKIKDLYRNRYYELQVATFYFILQLLLNIQNTNSIQNNIDKNFLQNPSEIKLKKSKFEIIYRFIYIGFFLDNIKYQIFFTQDLLPEKINYNIYYRYIDDYLHLFFQILLKNEIENIYNQINFVFSNLKYPLHDIIPLYQNKKLILFTLEREDLWRYTWDYPLIHYPLNLNNNNNHILGLLEFNKIKNEFVYKKNIDKYSDKTAVYLWIENENVNNGMKINNNKMKRHSERKVLKLEKEEIGNKTISDYKIKNIVIFTVAKVGSSDFEESMKPFNKKYTIIHTHNFLIFKNYVENMTNTLFIVGIRNPIDRNLSYFFQTYSDEIIYTSLRFKNNNYVGEKNYLFPLEDINKYSFDKLKDVFFKRNFHDSFNDWFKDFFEITNLHKLSFNKDKGLDFYKFPKNNILMFYTLEKLNDNETSISHFLEINQLIHSNLSEQKIYKDKYSEFKNKISFPKYYKDTFLHTNIMNYFYNDNDIQQFYNKYPTYNKNKNKNNKFTKLIKRK